MPGLAFMSTDRIGGSLAHADIHTVSVFRRCANARRSLVRRQSR